MLRNRREGTLPFEVELNPFAEETVTVPPISELEL